MADPQLNIRTTITSDSVQRLFGPPGAVDYRSAPGSRDSDNPVAVFHQMAAKEVQPLNDIKFLKGSIYSYKNRKIVTRWLRDVCAAFQLKMATLCLGVQLADYFIIKSLQTLAVAKCQLAAVTALWIAAKFEELDQDLPSLKSVVEVCDGAYTGAEVLDMEEEVLNVLQWKLPHTTLMNYLYLFLHLHIVAPLAPPAPPSSGAASALPSSMGATDVLLHLVSADATTKTRSTVSLVVPGTVPLQQSLAKICSAGRVAHTTSVELFELFGEDLMLAKRVDLTELPLARQPHTRRLSLFIATQGYSSAHLFSSGQSQQGFILLRTVNSLLLHMCEVLSSEVVTHVEFLRLRSPALALGVLALARCIVGTNVYETRHYIAWVVTTLDLSGSQALAAAELLCDKYKEALLSPEGLPAPLAPLPADAHERLKFVFSKQIQ